MDQHTFSSQRSGSENKRRKIGSKKEIDEVIYIAAACQPTSFGPFIAGYALKFEIRTSLNKASVATNGDFKPTPLGTEIRAAIDALGICHSQGIKRVEFRSASKSLTDGVRNHAKTKTNVEAWKLFDAAKGQLEIESFLIDDASPVLLQLRMAKVAAKECVEQQVWDVNRCERENKQRILARQTTEGKVCCGSTAQGEAVASTGWVSDVPRGNFHSDNLTAQERHILYRAQFEPADHFSKDEWAIIERRTQTMVGQSARMSDTGNRRYINAIPTPQQSEEDFVSGCLGPVVRVPQYQQQMTSVVPMLVGLNGGTAHEEPGFCQVAGNYPAILDSNHTLTRDMSMEQDNAQTTEGGAYYDDGEARAPAQTTPPAGMEHSYLEAMEEYQFPPRVRERMSDEQWRHLEDEARREVLEEWDDQPVTGGEGFNEQGDNE